MKLVNLSVIDEDAQNDIQSIHSNFTTKSLFIEEIYNRREGIYNYLGYQHHFIWAGDLEYLLRHELLRLKSICPPGFDSHRFIVTALTREPKHLTNLDHWIQFQQYGGNINRIHVQNSIGDDLENLLQRITSPIITDRPWWDKPTGIFPPDEDVDSYHFYAVSDKELKNLDLSYKKMLNSLERYPGILNSELGFRNWKMKTNIDGEVKIDNEWKYVLSLCNRKTTLI